MNLDELLKIAQAATPGPWTVEKYGQESLVIHYDRDNRVCFMATPGKLSDWKTIKLNAQHIATFNPRVAEALVNVAMAAEAMHTMLGSAFAEELMAKFGPVIEYREALANLRAAYAVDATEGRDG